MSVCTSGSSGKREPPSVWPLTWCVDYAGNTDWPSKVNTLLASPDGAGKINVSWSKPPTTMAAPRLSNTASWSIKSMTKMP